MQYEYEINEWIHYLVSDMSPFSNVYTSNPIFSINVVKISQDSWFYFTKHVSFWKRDESLWANGAKVWLFQGPFGEISCSWNLLFPCKMSTRLWVLTCLALGEPSLQLATCYSQTNPPSMNKWLSTLRHPAQAPRCSHQELCIDGVPSGAGPTRLQM